MGEIETRRKRVDIIEGAYVIKRQEIIPPDWTATLLRLTVLLDTRIGGDGLHGGPPKTAGPKGGCSQTTIRQI
jgi:hypothetical protein